MENSFLKTTTSITKFDIKGTTYYVKVNWMENETDLFHIHIFDGDGTWSGRFSKELCKKYREYIDETEEQYNDQVRMLLKEPTQNYFLYDFTINKDDSNSATFTWKKRFEDSNASLVHGSVPVQRDTSPESKDLLLDFLLEENRELRNAVDNLKGKNDIISKDLNQCKSELEKFVDIKISLEKSLYGKFVQLLNAKKRRMQLLEDSIHKFAKPNLSDNDQ